MVDDENGLAARELGVSPQRARGAVRVVGGWGQHAQHPTPPHLYHGFRNLASGPDKCFHRPFRYRVTAEPPPHPTASRVRMVGKRRAESGWRRVSLDVVSVLVGLGT